MRASKPCNKTELAGESGSRVVYCRVAEPEIGSVHFSLEAGAFRIPFSRAPRSEGVFCGQDGRHVH